jgi:hypothetical protein
VKRTSIGLHGAGSNPKRVFAHNVQAVDESKLVPLRVKIVPDFIR